MTVLSASRGAVADGVLGQAPGCGLALDGLPGPAQSLGDQAREVGTVVVPAGEEGKGLTGAMASSAAMFPPTGEPTARRARSGAEGAAGSARYFPRWGDAAGALPPGR